MSDFQIDARKWRFLNDPARYIRHVSTDLQLQPLTRQFKTAKEILCRLNAGCGVLLADDVGLGKTTVGALVAWVIALQQKRVRIYVPNEVLRRRWAQELERHVPMLTKFGASCDLIKQGDVGKLKAGRIQIATHFKLVKSHGHGKQLTACDLMIVDEAHRAKGDNSAFKKALGVRGRLAKRKLILTATPFSIKLAELEQLLQFVEVTDFAAIRQYAEELERLYSLGNGHDINAEAERIVAAASAAVDQLKPHLIRHGIDDLSASERKHFGETNAASWEIRTIPASAEELELLLRMDRILHLTAERKGERRNDPRFHIGWHHVGSELNRAAKRAADNADPIALKHAKRAKKSLSERQKNFHPKILSVSEAIRSVLDNGEKVLLFCHHRATASELLMAFEQVLKVENISQAGPHETVWRKAWESALDENKPLLAPIIDWLCSLGIRRQISGWLGEPAKTAKALIKQFAVTKVRKSCGDSPTILDAANRLVSELLDPQSKSTLALLRNIKKKKSAFGGGVSHFPGRLDDGFRVMGAWSQEANSNLSKALSLKTLYTGKPDIVLALFNSPFGPDVLVATDRLSEGVDLHRCCRHLVHYELDPSPVRTLQRNGRVRRVGSWAALTRQPINYAYPAFGGTRDEKAVAIMRQRINAFGLLLGGVPSLEVDSGDDEQTFAEEVLSLTRKKLGSLNRKLCA